jgi:hypothetical protein
MNLMEMKGVIPKLLNKSVINKDCFKRKVPTLLLHDKNISKIKAMNKNDIFHKIVQTQNKKTNDFVYQKNKINKNRLSNGLCMNTNILFSINKRTISSGNNSVISSIKNSSVKNYKNQSQNYDYLDSFKKYISCSKYKPNANNNNRTLTERNIINKFDNGKYGNSFSHSCFNEDVKNNLDFTFDDRHMKNFKPDPEPFPKKYNDYYSVVNKNVCFIPYRKYSYELTNPTSQRNINVDVDMSSNAVDQKLLFVLKNLKIDNLYQIFIKNGIYFRDLFLLSKDDLVEIKIPIGPRNRILYFIKLFNKSAKSYDFEELYNFFKDKKENQKIEAYHSLKKISIPHPSRNLNTLASINSQNEKRKSNRNRIKNINSKKYRSNLKLSLASLLYNIKNKSRNNENLCSKKLNGINIVEHYGCDTSKIKGKPNELIIDEIINNKKKSYSVHFDTFDNNNNANGYYGNIVSNKGVINKKEVKNKNKKTKKNNPIPIPKAPIRVNSVKYLNKYSPINTNFNNNDKIKKKTFQDSFERIKHNYEIFKRNKLKFGNEIYNSFLET